MYLTENLPKPQSLLIVSNVLYVDRFTENIHSERTLLHVSNHYYSRSKHEGIGLVHTPVATRNVIGQEKLRAGSKQAS